MTTFIKPFWLISALLLMLLSGTALTEASEKVVLYDTVSGQKVSLNQLSERFSDYHIMIFGEYHDNTDLHHVEAEFLFASYNRNPQLTVSLEMFERDSQIELERYLAGEISEFTFLAQSRPWNNYVSDYRPLVEFAKDKGLPVVAANIPHSIATMYVRQGSLDDVNEPMKQYLPAVHRVLEGEYKQRFFAQMQEISAKRDGMKVLSEQTEAFYRAQCLKDDTMAESIVMSYRQHPGRKIIHYQGDFHSRFRLGIVGKLQALEPSLKILVITPVNVADFTDLSVKAKSFQADGDIVVFVKQDISNKSKSGS